MAVYVPAKQRFLSIRELSAEGLTGIHYDNPDLKTGIDSGREIPGWFSYPSVLEELRKVYPPRSRQGFTLLPGFGSGKSTVAAGILYAKLIEGRQASIVA